MTNQRIDQNIQLRFCLCEAVECLREGLLGFVSEMLEGKEIDSARIAQDRQKNGQYTLHTENGQIRWDSRALLWVIDCYWIPVFREQWGNRNRKLVNLIKKAINKYCHEEPLTIESTTDTLRKMTRLLRQVPRSPDASKQAERIKDILTRIDGGGRPPRSISRFVKGCLSQLRLQKYRTIRKSEAIQRARKRGVPLSCDIRFANINKGNPGVWWLDIPISATETGAKTDISLLLYDGRNNKLHCLNIPILYFNQNRRGLNIAYASDGRLKIRMHLSTNKRDLFTDKRGDDSISFAQFKIN